MILPTTDPDGGQRSSLDVRERKSHSFLDGTVQAMNSFACQKSGGQFAPPVFDELPYCPFCRVGTCLGPSCLGKEKKKSPKSKLRIFPVTITLPGMKEESTLTTNTLTKIIKTSSTRLSKNHMLPLLFSDLFEIIAKPPISNSKKSKRKHGGKQENKVSICSTSAYNLARLQHFLLSCGSKRKSSNSFSSTTKSSRPVAMKGISLFRKLKVSEVPVKKKSGTGKVVETAKHGCLQSKVSALLEEDEDEDPNGSSFNLDELPDLLPGYNVNTVGGGGSRKRVKKKKKVSEAKLSKQTEPMKVETTKEASDTVTSMLFVGSAVDADIVTAGEDLVGSWVGGELHTLLGIQEVEGEKDITSTIIHRMVVSEWFESWCRRSSDELPAALGMAKFVIRKEEEDISASANHLVLRIWLGWRNMDMVQAVIWVLGDKREGGEAVYEYLTLQVSFELCFSLDSILLSTLCRWCCVSITLGEPQTWRVGPSLVVTPSGQDCSRGFIRISLRLPSGTGSGVAGRSTPSWCRTTSLTVTWWSLACSLCTSW